MSHPSASAPDHAPRPATGAAIRVAACTAAFLRQHWRYALWLLATVAWAATQRGSLFMAGMALGLSVPLLLWRLLRPLWVRTRLARTQALGSLLLWALACGAVWGITQWHEGQARHRADAVLAAIWQWQQAYGSFPPDLATLGLPAPRSTFEPHYMLHLESPRLFYRSAWVVFDTWSYDFEARQWRYITD